ncbi:DUF4238 domain-containing protein [Vibrio parahaemolyticus]|uniref:DUF4238 domain-containing protein n=1 Tax=Vibrio diabolicus TaxID=50719 RepID=UPI0021D319C2|nr:DUF4238 domain-containing protein [Vibrio parahaemolyticus]EHZ2539979.1 DUF4238 domain-containing protein [Vibrio parahaemolyticus]MDF4999652.1 DUF4238 domain-containing protein [Vibrio parahaemolyticus]MDF5321186.1 DUF4238 domain-containing protein [Vibrio parahaemolyticus]
MSSINHHYVPQLYLRGFIAESGRIQVFDKHLNSFKKDKQTPRTILFEKHRNTITHRGVRTDALEKLYGTIEAPLGQFFDLVRKGLSANELISKEGIYLLKVFVAFQFWRMPLLDPFVEQYIKTLDLKRFGNRITLNGVNIGDCDQIKSALENDSGFRHYFRSFMLPLLTFDFRVHDSDYESWKVHHVSPEYGGWNKFLTGDNPLLFDDLTEMFAFKSKFIMPLSNNQLITFSPVQNLAMDLGPLFTTYLAMATYNQCHRYVVGTNKDYIEQIKLFLGSEVEPSDLRAELFTYI